MSIVNQYVVIFTKHYTYNPDPPFYESITFFNDKSEAERFYKKKLRPMSEYGVLKYVYLYDIEVDESERGKLDEDEIFERQHKLLNKCLVKSVKIPKDSVIVKYHRKDFSEKNLIIGEVRFPKDGEEYKDLYPYTTFCYMPINKVFKNIDEFKKEYNNKNGIFSKIRYGKKVIDKFLSNN
jgi:hypothetical protein